ncbi:MAG: copper homeostasis periplasmic binding protein CopC [Acetobacteraceae bacterium]|nr:copper homeostasis periplasmic binding protein CopC [Acetobacteraceae bacterium]
MVVIRIISLAVAALAAGLSSAGAHAFLEHASPAVGSRVAASPATLDLSFTEGVVPHFSSVEVLNPSGQAMRTGQIRATNDGRNLIVALPPLPAGTYTVVWHVTSQDTHKTEGRFNFTVGQ